MLFSNVTYERTMYYWRVDWLCDAVLSEPAPPGSRQPGEDVRDAGAGESYYFQPLTALTERWALKLKHLL